MEPKTAPKHSRKERRKKDRQPIPKKWRLVLPILVIFAASLYACVLGYHYIQAVQQKKEEQKTAAAEKKRDQQLLTTIEKQQTELGNKEIEKQTVDDQLQQLIYLPITAQRKLLKQELKTLTAEAQQQLDGNTPFKLVGYVKKETAFGKVVSYLPVVDVYQRKAERWETGSSSQGKKFYMNKETADFPSVTDLFHDQATLTAIQPLIKQQLLDEAADKAAAIDPILNFPEMTMEQTILSYSPDKITLSLPENQLGLKQIGLPFSKILDFTDSAFIDPTVITENTPPALDPNKKYIALTFDDGPNPITTPRPS
ncbi:hypothetical protein [uncultured Enterococcus sp.]|uniref:hypothetical protein n=1 Tax=uncultured Enterococcus sp. TaxID=167972 RepID=UPI002AA6BF8D|nr:hypothetical protein [uncultured Enterococcus sp.]